MPSVNLSTRGYRAPRKGEICSARQTRSTKRSGAVIFSLSTFFFCSARGLLIIVLYCIVTTPFSSSSLRRRRRTPPPHTAVVTAAARHRRRRCRILLLLRCRSTPQLSPRSRSPTSFAFAACRRTHAPSHAPPHAAVVSTAAYSPILPSSSIKVVAHRVDRYH